MPGLSGFYTQKVCQLYQKRSHFGLEKADEFIKAGFFS